MQNYGSLRVTVSSLDPPPLFFYKPERTQRTNGWFLRLLYVLRVCLFVRPHLSSAQCITSYVTMQLLCIGAFEGLLAKLQQMKEVVCCLDGENLVDSRKDPVFAAYSY